MHETHVVTLLLDAVGCGDAAARERLMDLVYHGLRRMAAAKVPVALVAASYGFMRRPAGRGAVELRAFFGVFWGQS